jgi:hypothetical protein
MEVRRERQLNPVGDEVLAITAVVAPILMGVLSALKQDVVAEAGGHNNVKLKMLPRLYRPGDGDVGICFEYAVHEAMNNGDGQVLSRIESAVKLCRIKTTGLKSILFGMEKSGAVQLIDTAHNVLTEDSRALTGSAGQPPKLRRRLNLLAAAFKRPSTRLGLPYSIRGLWKADLFVGSVTTQQWVGTSIKINPSQLEGAAGLRVGIIPNRQGRSDSVRMDESKNMVICPLHHDGDFMQVFYEAWRIVQAFLVADAKLPKEALLPRPVDREICRILEERREFPTIDVIAALKVFGQPELLVTDSDQVKLETVAGAPGLTATLLAPVSKPL